MRKMALVIGAVCFVVLLVAMGISSILKVLDDTGEYKIDGDTIPSLAAYDSNYSRAKSKSVEVRNGNTYLTFEYQGTQDTLPTEYIYWLAETHDFIIWDEGARVYKESVDEGKLVDIGMRIGSDNVIVISIMKG